MLGDFGLVRREFGRTAALMWARSGCGSGPPAHHSPVLHPQSDAVTQLPGLDDTDKAIISVLQHDGRRPLTLVAASVGLSEAAVGQRVTRLTASGAMQIVAVADPTMLGYQRRAMIGLSVEGDVTGVADRLAGIDELDEGILVDARDRNRYRGEFEPVDPRPGHIPGARNLPAREMLDDHGRLLPDTALRGQLAEAGVSGDDVVASCGSGVTACHTLLVLEHLRLGGEARLYPGSYSQWSHTSRDVAT